MDVDLIKRLYYQEGLSCREIALKTHKTIGQIIYLMRSHNFKLRNAAETIQIQFYKKPLTFDEKQHLTLKDLQLKQAGLMLYWAEGNKTYNTVDLANSNEPIILIFLKMLRQIYGVKEEKIRVLLYCYVNQNKQKIINYWSKKLKIPKKQFIKPFVRKDYNPDKIGKMPYGLIHIRYNDKRLFLKIREEIDIITNDLLMG